jgi:hypothetical protein
MPTLVTMAVIIIILAVATYIVISVIRSGTGLQDLAPTPISLSSPTPLSNSQDVRAALLGSAGSTLSAFVNVQMGDRTVRMDDSNYSTLLGIPGVLEFQMAPAPTTAQGGLENAAVARLRVKTSLGAWEVIDVPPLPQQKWVFLTILRDGRRFDILYDESIVASHRLMEYPAQIANQISVGDKAFLGQVVHVLMAGTRLTPTQVQQQRAQLANTTGAPPIKFPLPLPIPFGSLQTTCLPGLPCNPIATPPPSGLKSWSTPYA